VLAVWLVRRFPPEPGEESRTVWGKYLPRRHRLGFAWPLVKDWPGPVLRALVEHELAHAALFGRGDRRWNDEALVDGVAEGWGVLIDGLYEHVAAEGPG
jgi:hypothetical protein